jgi:hypothetical protein
MTIYTFYKITCNSGVTDFTYIGSTMNFTRRKNHHKSLWSNPNSRNYNLKIYQTIRDFGGWDNWTMAPIENLECETKIDARIREQFWIDELKPILNMANAYGWNEEKQKQMCDKRKINARKKYDEDREKNRELDRQYREENHEQILAKERLYRAENRVNMLAKRRLYIEENRDKINARNRKRKSAKKAALLLNNENETESV